MKTARKLLDEILRYVKPPRGCGIALTEVTEGEPNWAASTGIMDDEELARYQAKIVELRKSDRRVDWSGESAREGEHRRRVAMRFSETEQ